MRKFILAGALAVAVLIVTAPIATPTSLTNDPGVRIEQKLYKYGSTRIFRCDGTETTTGPSKFVYESNIIVPSPRFEHTTVRFFFNGAFKWLKRTDIHHLHTDRPNRFYTQQELLGDGVYRFETSVERKATVTCEIRKVAS